MTLRWRVLSEQRFYDQSYTKILSQSQYTERSNNPNNSELCDEFRDEGLNTNSTTMRPTQDFERIGKDRTYVSLFQNNLVHSLGSLLISYIALKPSSHAKRLQFSNELLEGFLSFIKIFFPEKAHFLNGHVN